MRAYYLTKVLCSQKNARFLQIERIFRQYKGMFPWALGPMPWWRILLPLLRHCAFMVAEENPVSECCWWLSQSLLWQDLDCKIPVHANTEISDTVKKDIFYGQLYTVQERIPKGDVAIVVGDLIAKVGSDNAFLDSWRLNRSTILRFAINLGVVFLMWLTEEMLTFASKRIIFLGLRAATMFARRRTEGRPQIKCGSSSLSGRRLAVGKLSHRANEIDINQPVWK